VGGADDGLPLATTEYMLKDHLRTAISSQIQQDRWLAGPQLLQARTSFASVGGISTLDAVNSLSKSLLLILKQSLIGGRHQHPGRPRPPPAHGQGAGDRRLLRGQRGAGDGGAPHGARRRRRAAVGCDAWPDA